MKTCQIFKHCACDPDDDCDGRRVLLNGGPAVAIPLLRRERFRLELDVAYSLGMGGSTKWWHGPEAGIFLGFPAQRTQ